MHLASNRLGPALYSEFARVIAGMAGKGAQAGERGDVENDTAAVRLGLAHVLDGLDCHAGYDYYNQNTLSLVNEDSY